MQNRTPRLSHAVPIRLPGQNWSGVPPRWRMRTSVSVCDRVTSSPSGCPTRWSSSLPRSRCGNWCDAAAGVLAAALAERRAIVELADSTLVVGVDPADHPDRVCVSAGFEPGAEDYLAGPVPEVVSPAWKAPTSGGSTGRPKIIVAPTPAVITGTAAGEIMGMQHADAQLVAGPLYHNAPLMFSSYGLLLDIIWWCNRSSTHWRRLS